MQPFVKSKYKNGPAWHVHFDGRWYIVKNDNGNRLPSLFTTFPLAQAALDNYLRRAEAPPRPVGQPAKFK